MGDVVNLNRYRKSREKVATGRQAAENRVRSGQTKPAKAKLRQDAERQDAELDGKKLD
jgi:hypothetical protein